MTTSTGRAEAGKAIWAPTAITTARIVLAPVVAALVLAADQVVFSQGRSLAALLAGWAAGLFAVAALSDALDGWLARRLGAVSPLGAALDHAADKALGLAAGLALAATHLPLDLAAAVLAVSLRDVLIAGLREGLATTGRTMPVGRIGKLKAFAFLAGLGLALAWQWSAYLALSPALQSQLLGGARGLLYLAAALALLSGGLYLSQALRRRRPA